jgi:hypothetical protein
MIRIPLLVLKIGRPMGAVRSLPDHPTPIEPAPLQVQTQSNLRQMSDSG